MYIFEAADSLYSDSLTWLHDYVIFSPCSWWVFSSHDQQLRLPWRNGMAHRDELAHGSWQQTGSRRSGSRRDGSLRRFRGQAGGGTLSQQQQAGRQAAGRWNRPRCPCGAAACLWSRWVMCMASCLSLWPREAAAAHALCLCLSSAFHFEWCL